MAEVSLVKLVMAWCHQATSHYLSQCSRSLAPYGITRPQCVKAYSRASEKISASAQSMKPKMFFFHSFIHFKISASARRARHTRFSDALAYSIIVSVPSTVHINLSNLKKCIVPPWPRFILRMHPANERWHYIVMLPLIGWVHTQNGPWRPPS